MSLKKAFFTIATFTSILLIGCSEDDESKTAITLPANAGTSVADPAVALNPQHGQPGHRCDIAVGAPLNSSPSTAVTPVVTPPISTANTPAANTATLKFNPKHGEPGHRCDLAEGALLDGKKQ